MGVQKAFRVGSRAGGLLAGVAVFGLVGCSAPKVDDDGLARLERACDEAMERFRADDVAFGAFEDAAHGAAVLPSAGKGGVIYFGGASGTGLIYEGGEPIGTTRLSQASVGLQLGGQAFSQVVFFEDAAALERFTAGEFEFSAGASAVAADYGAASGAVFDNGYATFVMSRGGLMYEVSLAGQAFAFRPLEE
ncbi:MAG: YSC84-related protein [Planctomycetota bacterium]